MRDHLRRSPACCGPRPRGPRVFLKAVLTAGLLTSLAACGGGGGGAAAGAGTLSGRLVLPGGGAFARRAEGPAALAEQEPNDGALRAQSLGALALGESLVVRGHADAAGRDPFDALRVLVPQRARVTVTLALDPARGNDCDLALIDPTTGSSLAFTSSQDAQAHASLITKGLLDIALRAVRGAGPWTLTLAAESLPEVLSVGSGRTTLGELLPDDALTLSGVGAAALEVATPLAARLTIATQTALPLMLRDGTVVLTPDRAGVLGAAAASSTRLGVVAAEGQAWQLTLRALAPDASAGEALVLGPAPTAGALPVAWSRSLEAGQAYARVGNALRAGEALVLPRPDAGRDAEDALRAAGCRVLEAIPEGGACRVALDLDGIEGAEERAQATLARVLALTRCPALTRAEPNHRRQALVAPNDPRYRDQWHYPLLRLPEAWDVTTGSASVIVAVIDTGITAHPDLAGQSVSGYDFIADVSNGNDGDGRDSDPTDPGDGAGGEPPSWHGTHVAGTIGAASHNGVGVAGVTWGCKLMNLRVLGPDGGDDFDIANAVLYAAGLANISGRLPAQRASVINMSLGGGDRNATFEDACAKARAAGVVIVAAAGNESTSDLSYPAAFAGVVAVGAVDRNKALTSYSNYGSWVDCVAPGGDSSAGASDGVLSTLPSEDGRTYGYEFYDGTSMSSPHAAGVAALVFSVKPTLTPDQVEGILFATAEDLGATGRDNTFGNGLFDAYAAVVKARDGGTLPPPPPSPDPDPTPTPTDATIWVLALDAATEETLAEVGVDPTQGLSFTLEGLAAGSYYLVAGTDLDGDGLIGAAGDLFGAYPDPDAPEAIDLSDGGARTGLAVVLVEVDDTAEDEPDDPDEGLRRPARAWHRLSR